MAGPVRAYVRAHWDVRFGGLFARRLGRLNGDDGGFCAFAGLVQFELWRCHDDGAVDFVALIHAVAGTGNRVVALVTGVDDEVITI